LTNKTRQPLTNKVSQRVAKNRESESILGERSTKERGV